MPEQCTAFWLSNATHRKYMVAVDAVQKARARRDESDASAAVNEVQRIAAEEFVQCEREVHGDERHQNGARQWGDGWPAEFEFTPLEDPEGAPYPEPVQALAQAIEEQLDDGLRDDLVAALESVRQTAEETL